MTSLGEAVGSVDQSMTSSPAWMSALTTSSAAYSNSTSAYGITSSSSSLTSSATTSVTSALEVAELVAVTLVVSALVILTAGGNLLVIVSFKVDRKLQTISNYFLLSLSVADFAIGQCVFIVSRSYLLYL